MPNNRNIPRTCEGCDTAFLSSRYEINQGGGRFCTRLCANHHKRPRQPQSVEEAFWSRIEERDGCWLWTGRFDPHGYGLMPNGTKAHRFAFQVFVGPLRPSDLVCHDCPGGDNQACVNPGHLFPGTHSDNMRDARNKTASRDIIRRRTDRLRPSDAKAIRVAYARGGVQQDELAARYGVSRSLVGMIVRRKRWAHISDLME